MSYGAGDVVAIEALVEGQRDGVVLRQLIEFFTETVTQSYLTAFLQKFLAPLIVGV